MYEPDTQCPILIRPQSLYCQINTINIPMSSFAQFEWSICFRWETQFCFVTRRARVTNHGLAASDRGCQRLEMASLLLLSDAIWFFMILYDAIWFSTMLCCGAIWCYFKTDRPLHDVLICASKETWKCQSQNMVKWAPLLLPTRWYLSDDIWSQDGLVKRGCQLFLKRGLLSLPTQDNTRVAFYSPQMPYAVSTVDPIKPGAAGLMKQVSGPY